MENIKDFVTFCAACNDLLARNGNTVFVNPPTGAYFVEAANHDTYTFNASGAWAMLHYADPDIFYRFEFGGGKCVLTRNGITVWKDAG